MALVDFPICFASFAIERLPSSLSKAIIRSGVFSSVFSSVFTEVFPGAVSVVPTWALSTDTVPGCTGSRMKGRTDEYRAFGGQLDSLIDIVSFGICPAVFLLSYGEFNPWFLPGAFVIVATSAIRLSYFNVFGLIDDSTYMGLALDNNVIILAFVFLFDGFFSQPVFSVIIYAMLMFLAVFNLAPVRTPKFAGRWVYVLLVYVLGLTVIYSWILWSKYQ